MAAARSPQRTRSNRPEKKAAPAGPEGGADLMTMDEAIAMLKTTRPTFYRWLREGKFKGYKVGRQWRFRREDLDRFLAGQAMKVDLPVSPATLIADLEAGLKALGVAPPSPRPDNPIHHAVTLMARLALARRASDLHLGPQHEGGKDQALLRFRVDGVLQTVARFDLRLLGPVVERWKQMAALSLAERHLPQDGRIVTDVEGVVTDWRICVVPALHGESLTARLLVHQAIRLELEWLGYAPADLARLREAIARPSGLVIFNGPTGSGKTTAMYCCLTAVAREAVKTVSIEDPVEYLLPWTTQVQIDAGAGLTFPRAIRAALRSDPDILLVGEIRDRETANLCVQVALTGHVVLTTLHAGDSAEGLRRLVEVGVPAFVAGDATTLVVSQRLVRKLCDDCARPYAPSAADVDALRAQAAAGGLTALAKNFRQPVGCPTCGGNGFRGRTTVVETLRVSPTIGQALREGADVERLRRLAVEEGMTTLAADGIRKAAEGTTSLLEVQRVLALSGLTL